MMQIDVGRITLVGPCHCDECATSTSGTTIQITDFEGCINVPLGDIEAFVEAVRKVATS